MRRSLRIPLLALVLCFVIIGGFTARLAAYPPAPHSTLYGIVRDQVGNTLKVQNAQLLLLRDNIEVDRTLIFPETKGDLNYELQIRLDHSRTASRIYSPRSIPTQGLYTLVVDVDGERYYPIEVAGTLRAGNGGERARLDLTLGTDANRDGLPDVWQQWVLYQAGRFPGSPEWNIDLVTREGDFDQDGVSNYQEYVAGTFAGDATQRLELLIKNKTATAVEFEFFAITDKVYAIEQSTDLKTWVAVPFSLSPTAPKTLFQTAKAVVITPAYVDATPGPTSFYRLTVR